MTYQKVTNVANYDAMLGLLSTFIGGLTGWTITNNLGAATVDVAGASAANGRVLIAGKGDCLVGLRSTVSGPGANRLYLFDGVAPFASGNEGNLNGNSGLGSLYIGSSVVNNGGVSSRGLQQFVGPYPTLYLFSNATADYVHCVLEVQTGVFLHLHFGNLIHFGTWTGGGYYSCTVWNLGDNTQGNPISIPGSNSHTAPFDNQPTFVFDWTVHYEQGADHWIAPSGDTTQGGVIRRQGRGSVRGGFGRAFKNITESLFSGLIPLAPILIGKVQQADTPPTIRFIGEVPDFRMINMTNLAPADEFSIGSDTWKVFPLSSKNGAVHSVNSGVAGFAYKKIP